MKLTKLHSSDHHASRRHDTTEMRHVEKNAMKSRKVSGKFEVIQRSNSCSLLKNQQTTASIRVRLKKNNDRMFEIVSEKSSIFFVVLGVFRG